MPNVGVLPPAARRRSFRSGCVPTSLRLRSTFPFAEPQTEALQNLLGIQLETVALDERVALRIATGKNK
jgi:hypothetical protein